MSRNLILHGGAMIEPVDRLDVGCDGQLGISDPRITNALKFRQGIGKAIRQPFAKSGLCLMQRQQCLNILGLWCVEGVEFESEECHEHLGFTMKVSWEDLWFLETVVRAADTYSHRASTGWRVEGITDQGFDDLLKWLAGSENELFRSKINT